jgi:tol-pal system protein YbgF
VWRLVPLVFLSLTSGCFATRGDVRVIQGDIATLRTELVRSQKEQNESLTQAIRLLQVASDSLARVSVRTVGIQGDLRGEMRDVRAQILQVQQLLGQSQATIARLRAELEARQSVSVPVTQPTPAPGAAGAAPDSTAAAAGPGPNQLFMSGRDQLLRGSTSTARSMFQELITKYPNHDLAPDAQFWIAESLAKEKNAPAADAAFAAVVQTYPNADLAARALYKRGLLALEQGSVAQGKAFLEQVVARYPRSDSAELAKETLKTLR